MAIFARTPRPGENPQRGRGGGQRSGPEVRAYQHPQLTLGQVHSALAYYWDHQEEIDADLRRREALVEEIRREIGSHPLIAKLRDLGQI